MALNGEADLETEADFAGRQDRGERPNQEDNYGVVPPSELGGGRALLSIVADGMGGHAAGEVASEIAVQAFVDGFFNCSATDDCSRLWEGLELANREVGRSIKMNPSYAGMGTTLVSLLIREGVARWISIGDSRLILVRNGEIHHLNRLHLANGDSTPEEVASEAAGRHPASGALAAAIIGERLFDVDDPDPVSLESGDLLLVTSDGLNTLPEAELLKVLNQHPNATAAESADLLIEAVKAQGHPRQDNTTIVAIRWT